MDAIPLLSMLYSNTEDRHCRQCSLTLSSRHDNMALVGDHGCRTAAEHLHLQPVLAAGEEAGQGHRGTSWIKAHTVLCVSRVASVQQLISYTGITAASLREGWVTTDLTAMHCITNQPWDKFS